MQYTQKQQAAIWERDKSILVSAAAGSGKTSVLSERIARLVQQGADIKNMLVCTFTNLAAGEMKERIYKRLMELAEQTEEPRLYAQAERALQADICTIHKFAISVIQQNLLLTDLKTNVRIAAGKEVEILKAQAMEQALEELCQQQESMVQALYDKYCQKNDRPIVQMVMQIYNFIMSKKQPMEWMKRAGQLDAQTEKEFLKTYQNYVVQSIYRAQADFEQSLALSRKMGYEAQQQIDLAHLNLTKKWIKMATLGGLEQLRAEISGAKFHAIARGIPEEAVKKKLSGWKSDAKKQIDGLRDLMTKNELSKELREDYKSVGGDIAGLNMIVQTFHRVFQDLKRERNIIDYDDMLHMAYQILSGWDGEKNFDVAKSYQQRYEYIFVDEYQDTNGIQEAILQAVSRKDNMFMVGDMKQSIYKFRLADPSIFREKASCFEKSQGQSMLVNMNENFRCSKKVVDFINGFMSKIMSSQVGDICYGKEESLIWCGREAGSCKLSLAVAERGILKEEIEAKLIAKEIKKLLGKEFYDEKKGQTRPLVFSDFCIIMRTANRHGEMYKSVLQQQGIPVKTLFEAQEDDPYIEVFVNLLRLVDNPYRDIELLSVMRSFIGGFHERDLAQVRLADEQQTFAQAFFSHDEFEDPVVEQKAKRLKEKLRTFAIYARTLPVKEALLKIKAMTHFDAYLSALPGGAVRMAAFESFIKMCLGINDARIESFYAFVEFLQEYKKNIGKYVETVQLEEEVDAVRILTVHASKGLEFPVVFVSRMQGKYNTRDFDKELLIHDTMGIGMKHKDAVRHVAKDTQMRKLIALRLTGELKSESLRVLYVALTRARHTLVLTGVLDQQPDEVRYGRPLCDEAVLSMNNWLDLVLSWGFSEGQLNEEGLLPMEIQGEEEQLPQTSEKTPVPTIEALKKAAQQMEQSELKKMVFVKVPRTMTVSEMKQSMQTRQWLMKSGDVTMNSRREDTMDAKELLPYEPAEWNAPEGGAKGPQSSMEAEASLPWSATQRGSGLHRVLEVLDFSNEDISGQIELLGRAGRLTVLEREIARKEMDLLQWFLRSEMAGRIAKSKKVLREQPFKLWDKASAFGYESSDKIMVQGVIDLAFWEQDEIVLLDHKTDRVDGTALEERIRYYRPQVAYYAKALEEITGYRVKEQYLNFISCKKLVKLNEG